LGDDFDNLYTASETGEVMWTSLEERDITLTICADRFLPKTVRVSLERGPNELVVILEDDPITAESQSP
jgi:hypothetical protein